MKAYVVVEGLTDAKLITTLLPQEIQQHTTVVPAGGRNNLTSVARTLLVTRRKPLAVVVDADTVDESSVLDLRRQTEEWLRAVSGGTPFKVFMMVPEIEALLFKVPAALERATGQKLSVESTTLSKFKPHQVIQQLGVNKTVVTDQIVNGFTTEDMDVLRGSSPIKELIEFLSIVGQKLG